MKKILILAVATIITLACSDSFAKRQGKGKGKGKEVKAKRLESPAEMNPEVKEQLKKRKTNMEKFAQQKKTTTEQMTKEFEKHKTRQAKLQRILEIAIETENEKMTARVNKLMAKETTRYQKKKQRMLKKQTGTPAKGEVGKNVSRTRRFENKNKVKDNDSNENN